MLGSAVLVLASMSMSVSRGPDLIQRTEMNGLQGLKKNKKKNTQDRTESRKDVKGFYKEFFCKK